MNNQTNEALQLSPAIAKNKTNSPIGSTNNGKGNISDLNNITETNDANIVGGEKCLPPQTRNNTGIDANGGGNNGAGAVAVGGSDNTMVCAAEVMPINTNVGSPQLVNHDQYALRRDENKTNNEDMK